ncbi:hypothetical protein [Herbidospora daliensis]|uniref:hypothetical protein n=1 Tax=Herbidospora daliensis TaxID=295585 RepID=UPI000B13E5C1|nr:hypothetical protein [Herbidospora daliensis]
MDSLIFLEPEHHELIGRDQALAAVVAAPTYAGIIALAARLIVRVAGLDDDLSRTALTATAPDEDLRRRLAERADALRAEAAAVASGPTGPGWDSPAGRLLIREQAVRGLGHALGPADGKTARAVIRSGRTLRLDEDGDDFLTLEVLFVLDDRLGR